MDSFLCVSAKFQPISESFTPVRKEGRKREKDGDSGERPTLTTIDYFLKYRLDLQFASARIRTDALSIFSCQANGNSGFPQALWQRRNPKKPSQNEAIHACPETVCPSETVALGKAWVGDANLNLTRAPEGKFNTFNAPRVQNILPRKRNWT